MSDVAVTSNVEYRQIGGDGWTGITVSLRSPIYSERSKVDLIPVVSAERKSKLIRRPWMHSHILINQAAHLGAVRALGGIGRVSNKQDKRVAPAPGADDQIGITIIEYLEAAIADETRSALGEGCA